MKNTYFKLVSTSLIIIVLSACGGGGGNSADVAVTGPVNATNLTITGTAATGLAIAGATVTGKCKVGVGTGTTLANGTFTLVVTEGQLPCVLQITNPVDNSKLHTLVSGTGNNAVANITPLTEMTTARVLGSEPNVFFAAFDVAVATQKITTAGVATAQTAVNFVLTGTINTTGIGDFITTPLVAATQGSPASGDNHDKLLDALKLKFTAAQVGTVTTALASGQTTDAIKQTVISLTAAPTTPPVANAGTAQSVSTATTVTLDASTSSAGAGKSLTYAWTLTSKPAGSTTTLNASTTVRPSFVADVPGSYVASVIVNDGTTVSSAAAVTVTASAANAAPIANAGVAQRAVIGSTATLNGSASTDVNGDTLTYAWSLTAKPVGSTALLSSSTLDKPTFVADLPGTYVATLIVNDGQLSGASATTTVTVAPRISGAVGISTTDNYSDFCGMTGQFTIMSTSGSGVWSISNCKVYGTAGSPLLASIQNNGNTALTLTQIHIMAGHFGNAWNISPSSQTINPGSTANFSLPLWLSLEVTNAVATFSLAGEPDFAVQLKGSMHLP